MATFPKIGATLALSFYLFGLAATATGQTPGAGSPGRERQLAPQAVSRFHEATGKSAVWSDADFAALLTALEGLADHGLNPDHYHYSRLSVLLGDRLGRDRLATDGWFSAAAHMIYGKLDPISVEPNWTAAGRTADLAAILKAALGAGTVANSLEALAPKQPEYRSLVDELGRLRKAGETPVAVVPAGALLKKEMTGARVARLQERLVQLGLITQGDVTGRFDQATDVAVRAFQFGAGLDADGVVGPASLAALNRGTQARIDQLRVNLERWRWLPEDLGRRHVRVNIAGFNVTTWQDDALVRSHLAIVGKPFRKTPVFSDEIEYVVFNPWWETPPNLARADKLPLFKRDPTVVQRLGFQVLDGGGRLIDASTIDWSSLTASSFPYRIRQAPGEMNALGPVKIMLPNRHNVYLHDTPTRGLFAQRQRAFSSGCIRTQDAVDLAQWLLVETPGWDRARIDRALAGGKETRANLSTPVPVHVLYSTAVAEPDGSVRYLDDLYQRDAAVLAGLRLQARGRP